MKRFSLLLTLMFLFISAKAQTFLPSLPFAELYQYDCTYNKKRKYKEKTVCPFLEMFISIVSLRMEAHGEASFLKVLGVQKNILSTLQYLGDMKMGGYYFDDFQEVLNLVIGTTIVQYNSAMHIQIYRDYSTLGFSLDDNKY